MQICNWHQLMISLNMGYPQEAQRKTQHCTVVRRWACKPIPKPTPQDSSCIIQGEKGVVRSSTPYHCEVLSVIANIAAALYRCTLSTHRELQHMEIALPRPSRIICTAYPLVLSWTGQVHSRPLGYMVRVLGDKYRICIWRCTDQTPLLNYSATHARTWQEGSTKCTPRLCCMHTDSQSPSCEQTWTTSIVIYSDHVVIIYLASWLCCTLVIIYLWKCMFIADLYPSDILLLDNFSLSWSLTKLSMVLASRARGSVAPTSTVSPDLEPRWW